MPKRRLKAKKQELLSKNKIKSFVVEEVNVEEARKDLLEAEFILTEYKPALQMHPKSRVEDEDQSAPWYFTHV